MRSKLRTSVAATFMLAGWMVSVNASAAEARHSAAVSVLADDDHSRLWQAKLGLPLGERAWAQANLGRTDVAAGGGDTTVLGAALGVDGRHVGAAVEFTRRNSDAMEIADWQGSIKWRAARGELGAHALWREAEYETTSTTQTAGLFGPTLTTVVSREAVKGEGFGMHGRFDITPQVRIFGGWLRYHYDFTRESPATGGGTVLQTLLSGTAASGVTRDQALIERSWHAGASYVFERHIFAVQYLHDRIALSGATLRTWQAQAELAVGRHWWLVPVLGRSSGDTTVVEFGGLGAVFKW